MNIKGLVVAAGLSSRMGDFKPLLPINGRPMLQATVESLRQGGITDILVVLGKRAGELEALLAPIGVRTICNEAFEETEMFDSVCLGLANLGDCDGVLFLPADVPMVSVHTMEALQAGFSESGSRILYPTYQGERGHPPLLGASVLADIVCFKGEGGLRGALASLGDRAGEVAVADRGCLLDADYQKDYLNLQLYQAMLPNPERTTCLAILDWAGTSLAVRAHCGAVADLAVEIGYALKKKGHFLDLALIEKGALLHDVLRAEKHHAQAGATLLNKLGHYALAQVVGAHLDLPPEAKEALDERAIVFLADKMVIEDQRVGIEARFVYGLKKYGVETTKGIKMRQRKADALAVAQRIKEIVEEGGNG